MDSLSPSCKRLKLESMEDKRMEVSNLICTCYCWAAISDD